MIKIDKKDFISVCKSQPTMAKAASVLNLHFNTFKKYAKKFGCYVPNPGGKGVCGEYERPEKIPLEDILIGKYPSYQTYKLKQRLIKSGLKKNKCEKCNIIDWQKEPISMELDHIDGNRNNHKLENLRILCPNCHSQTPTFRSKNI